MSYGFWVYAIKWERKSVRVAWTEKFYATNWGRKSVSQTEWVGDELWGGKSESQGEENFCNKVRKKVCFKRPGEICSTMCRRAVTTLRGRKCVHNNGPIYTVRERFCCKVRKKYSFWININPAISPEIFN